MTAPTTRSVTIETVRRVYDDNEGVFIEVGPDRDGVGCVEIHTSGESAKWFGEVRLVLSPEIAMKLGEALCLAAKDVSP